VRRRILVVAAAVGLGATSCAYYNALYNAKREFTQAELARARGQTAQAHQGYGRSIEKAALSLRRSPEGRWSDEALYLIGRARFARGEYAQSRAALLGVRGGDRATAAGALAYLGAAELRLDQPDRAVERLDEAVSLADGFPQISAFAHLWRGRARFVLGDVELAWRDLEAAGAARGVVGAEADLERATRALERRDAAQMRGAITSLFGGRIERAVADSVRQLALGTAAWDPALAQDLLTGAATAALPAESRWEMRLAAVEVLLRQGEDMAAEQELRVIAARSDGASADRARSQLAARRLARATDVDELTDIRAGLLASVRDPEARRLLVSMQTLLELLERARESGQPLAVFAAAEHARDELGAPRLARRLFLGYAELAPSAVWTPKSLLAAHALAWDEAESRETAALLAERQGGPYLDAVAGAVDSALYASAEERLGRATSQLQRDAAVAAASRDPSVVRAVVVLDSLRAEALADSLRAPCGLMIDSLAVTGELADSVRAACLRRDAERVDSLMRADSLRRSREELPPPATRDTTRT
jgi:hypothetical protein